MTLVMYSWMYFTWWCVAVACFVRAQYSGLIVFPDDPKYFGEIAENKTGARGALETTPPPPAQSNGKSLQMCKKYADSYCQEKAGDIPLFGPAVYKGMTARATEFPHMALIGFKGRGGSGVQWKCGGSLISERFVLSAAHCNSLIPTRVRLGDLNIRSTEDEKTREARAEEFNIIQVMQHPEYDDLKKYNDITLYKLDRDVKFNDYIKPICLHNNYEVPTDFIVSGWGSIEFAGPSSDVLMKGRVSLVTPQECKSSLDPPLLQSTKSEVRDESMICAANFETGTDACQGDSGGPLQYQQDYPVCLYSQVGVTSFGIGCGSDVGSTKYPAVYTRVSHYVPWIESIVWP